MAHGTLSVLIREEDYRPFLVALYSLACFAADSGNRYSPEDAYIPGGTPGDGNKYHWPSRVNSVLQPKVGLRWLLCYEENDQELCHLQKAAPKHWFRGGETICVDNCRTRFGLISWSTIATSDDSWKISLSTSKGFSGDIALHIHPDNGARIRTTSGGAIQKCYVFSRAPCSKTPPRSNPLSPDPRICMQTSSIGPQESQEVHFIT
jgi:hypothetical protein